MTRNCLILATLRSMLERTAIDLEIQMFAEGASESATHPTLSYITLRPLPDSTPALRP